MSLRAALRLSLLTAALSGCAAPSGGLDSPPLDGAMARSRATSRPLVLLFVDPSRGAADARALAAFESVAKTIENVVAIAVDLGTSRNRAAAIAFHATDAPTLVCRSAAGVIVSRDEGPIDADAIRTGIESARRRGPELDVTFAALRSSARDARTRMTLAEFLAGQGNAAESIPAFRAVADDASADVALRVRAWVEADRAHLWIGEPEKARYSSIALIDTLGPRTPDAIAGGNLIRGMQDAAAKRWGRSREEFALAIASAPASPYANEAAARLAKLPAEGGSP